MLLRYTIFYKHSQNDDVCESICKTDSIELLLVDLQKQKHPSVYVCEPITGSDDYDEAVNLFNEIVKIGVQAYLDKSK